MRFGIIAGPVFPPPAEMSTSVAFTRKMQMCIAARDTGFDGISLPHHYLTGPDGQVFPPLVTAGYIAATCPGMFLATTILILPLEHPVRMAEQAAALDVMTGGKFLFGVGQGYREIEFQSLGIPRKEKSSRTVESCRLMRALWAGGAVTFKGDHYAVDNGTASINPVRKGGPPLVIGADKPISIGRIPEYADHWLPSPRHSRSFIREMLPEYKEKLDQSGRSFVGLPIIRDICVGRTRDHAISIAKQALDRQYSIQRRWKQPGENYEKPIEELMHDRLIVGTAHEATEEILKDHEEFRADFMWFRLSWPGMEIEECLDVIKRIGEKVIPAVKSRVGGESLFDPQNDQTHDQ